MVGFHPKSSILIGISVIFTIHFGVFPYFLETPIYGLLGSCHFTEDAWIPWKVFVSQIPENPTNEEMPLKPETHCELTRVLATPPKMTIIFQLMICHHH